MTTQTTAKPAFKYSHTIGNAAAGGQVGFRHPVDVAVAPGGLLYVLNNSYEFQEDGKWVVRCNITEDYLGKFGSNGTADGQFVWPNAIAVDRQGNVFVTDEYLHRISTFDPEGNFLFQWGALGDEDGQWERPAGIVFDRDNNLLVADSFNHRIQKFTPEGRFLGKWGGLGTGEGQFNTPWGITLDRQGNVYVADWRNDRIQEFDPNGQFLMRLGASGSGDGQFNRPTGVAVDREGLIYVVDSGNDRVQVFDGQGRYITQFLGDAGMSKWGRDRLASNPESMLDLRAKARSMAAEQRFYQPVGIETDDQGHILVAESGRHRLQIYQKVS
ncbi:MAG: 6-bladed beta-propeller [SAR202 cluster bacterium]|nr:6-bladed beta-propeller [SAR202 cluster bacterium]